MSDLFIVLTFWDADLHPSGQAAIRVVTAYTIRLLRGSKAVPRPLGALVTLPVTLLSPWFYTLSMPG